MNLTNIKSMLTRLVQYVGSCARVYISYISLNCAELTKCRLTGIDHADDPSIFFFWFEVMTLRFILKYFIM